MRNQKRDFSFSLLKVPLWNATKRRFLLFLAIIEIEATFCIEINAQRPKIERKKQMTPSHFCRRPLNLSNNLLRLFLVDGEEEEKMPAVNIDVDNIHGLTSNHISYLWSQITVWARCQVETHYELQRTTEIKGFTSMVKDCIVSSRLVAPGTRT